MSNGEVDAEVWERKDKLNSRMSALKAASTVSEGTAIPAEVVIAEADKYYKWLTQDQSFAEKENVPGNSSNSNSTNTVYPVPTTGQLKWLTAIKEKHGYTAEQVFDKCKKYPSNKDQALECVKLMKQ